MKKAKTERKAVNSLRVTFDKEDMEFMDDYQSEYGVSLQWFVEKSVKDRIEVLKVKQQLGEI